ncbi:MAG: electron transfer flavoprotein subunit alpha/FixB family protein [Candidatus Cloacimonadales bacterium]
MNIKDYQGIMVFAEQRDGNILPVSFELLGRGRELADERKQKLSAAILGSELEEEIVNLLIAYGADEVVLVDAPQLKRYSTEPYTKALCEIINQYKPETVFIGATSLGRDLAPRVSARLETGLTADCTTLAIDAENDNLLMTRPAFGGNILATIICPQHRPQMATVRPGVMQKQDLDTERSGKIIKLDVNLTEADLNIEILEEVIETKSKKKIEEANTLIAGGRGLGKAENLIALEILAKELKGMVAGSRGIVDAGWIAAEQQVGQTGKTVRPELYIACGISGAIQHVAGMEDSEFIVAINNNPTASIFETADLGIVADVNKLIPELIKELNA